MSERVYKNIETVHIILVNYTPLPSINKMIKIVFIADIKIFSLRVRKSKSFKLSVRTPRQKSYNRKGFTWI